MSERLERLAGRLSRYRYVLIVAAVGLVLLLWPSGGRSAGDGDTDQARLAAVLAQIEGVGQTEVLLSDSGAVVVCAGAGDASVRLGVTQAVRCYTGLGADRVVIYQMEENRR